MIMPNGETTGDQRVSSEEKRNREAVCIIALASCSPLRRISAPVHQMSATSLGRSLTEDPGVVALGLVHARLKAAQQAGRKHHAKPEYRLRPDATDERFPALLSMRRRERGREAEAIESGERN